MTYPMIRPISYGWGINAEGGLRKPNELQKESPIVIDDSIIGIINQELLNQLLPYCKNGCILDLERKPTRFHIALLEALRKNQISPIWIPQKYASYLPDAYCMIPCELPHNSWKSFCKAQQSLYRNGWTLEYHPLQITKHSAMGATGTESVYLQEAICMIERRNNQIYYYDTVQTILEKSRIAAQFGCKGFVGIADEWAKLRKK